MVSINQTIFACTAFILESATVISGLSFFSSMRFKKKLFTYALILLFINIIPAIFVDPGKPLLGEDTSKTIFVIPIIFTIISVMIILITYYFNGHSLSDCDIPCIVAMGTFMFVFCMLYSAVCYNNAESKEAIETNGNSYEVSYETAEDDIMVGILPNIEDN